MKYAHGAVQWLSADVATTTYTVSGLPFQPKALRFYWVGLQSATDAASEVVNERRGVGFAVSTGSRRSIGSFSQDTAATSNCGVAARDDCVACTTDGAGASDGRLDLNAINADGFQLIVDDAAPANVTVFWEAWGGDEITVAVVGDIAEPAATGDQDYTVAGFKPDAKDQVVMFAGCQSTAALNTDAAADSGMCVGFATSGATADNVTVCGNSDDASAAMDTDGYCKTGECLSMIVLAGGNPDARAQLTQFNEGGFRLNWIARATTSRRYFFLALKGGGWKAGAYTIAGNTGSATATVSGLPFKPVGISLIGRMSIESTAGTSAVDDRIGLGSGGSPQDRRSMGVLDENATASSACEIDTSVQYDQVLTFPSTAGAELTAYDINAMNADGFQIIVDVAGGVASEWHGYLAFGDAVPAPSVAPPYPPGAADVFTTPFMAKLGVTPEIGNRPRPPVARPGPGLAGLARFRRSEVLQTGREIAVAGQTVAPDPVAAAFATTTPTVVLGAVTLTPSATAAAFTALDPTVTNGAVTVLPDPVAAAFTAPDPTLVLGAVTLAPDPVVAAFSVLDPTIVVAIVIVTGVKPSIGTRPPPPIGRPGPGGAGLTWFNQQYLRLLNATPPVAVTLAPSAVVAAFVATDPVVAYVPPPDQLGVSPTIGRFSETPPVARPGPGRPGLARLSEWQRFRLGNLVSAAGQTVSPDPVVASFTIATPTLVVGAVTIAPSPVAAAFSVVDPTLFTGVVLTPSTVVASFTATTPALLLGGVTLAPSAVAAAFTATTPVIVLGAVTVTPGSVIAAFSTTVPALFGGVVLSPAPVTAAFSAIAPTVLVGGLTLTPGPAIAAFTIVVPTVFVPGAVDPTAEVIHVVPRIAKHTIISRRTVVVPPKIREEA